MAQRVRAKGIVFHVKQGQIPVTMICVTRTRDYIYIEVDSSAKYYHASLATRGDGRHSLQLSKGFGHLLGTPTMDAVDTDEVTEIEFTLPRTRGHWATECSFGRYSAQVQALRMIRRDREIVRVGDD